jgi:hypothetical protein
MSKKILLIHGSFGSALLPRVLSDWKQVKVIEMDACLPQACYQQGAEQVLKGKPVDYVEGDEIDRRVHELLELFLADRAYSDGLEIHRSFRAACISMDSYKMLCPYLLNLRMARRLIHAFEWEQIIVSPGSGVCTLAWQQLAQALGIPLVLLPVKPAKPLLLWQLKRKWQKRQLRNKYKVIKPGTAGLPVATEKSAWVCVDARLHGLLAEDDGHWSRIPDAASPSAEEMTRLRQDYLSWWADWLADWRRDHPQKEALDDTVILETFGRHHCEEVYPAHALRLVQARKVMKRLSPQCVIAGAMWGKIELMWLLAARELGIKTALYTLDDSVNPAYSFEPDFVFCDDQRHVELALKRGISAQHLFMVKTHRLPTLAKTKLPTQRARPQVVLVDTFFSGWRIIAMPSISLWAIRLAVETARLMPDYDFFIKFHPIRETPQEKFNWGGFSNLQLWQRECYFRSLNPPKNISLKAPEDRLSVMLETTDVLLNIQSYSAFEAFALSVPVIHVVEPNKQMTVYKRLLDLDAIQVASTAETLVPLITSNVKQLTKSAEQIKRQHQFMKQFYVTEGQALGEQVRFKVY